ncbi:hypothetical protein NPIL_57831 [Nephila pilipes]|uniref:Uncharacterized protein n=1 Tax=Nephila pilipes TaxID=299642 RepID=A0A8X6K449_NEPPI|nr:hypothetical protein NPIL_623151 [Nephila pilipes]GFU35601.1 hypothetical protein NPIL_57831 [Nephila pilipes]
MVLLNLNELWINKSVILHQGKRLCPYCFVYDIIGQASALEHQLFSLNCVLFSVPRDEVGTEMNKMRNNSNLKHKVTGTLSAKSENDVSSYVRTPL